MIVQLDANGSVQHRYLWGPAVDQILADETVDLTSGTAQIRWALGDQLNSTRDLATLDSANHAAIIDHIIYDAFGKVTSESYPANSTALKFTGHYTDPQTGLQWNLNRWYDTALHQ